MTTARKTKVNAGKVARFMKQVLGEHGYRSFLKTIPQDVMNEALFSSDPYKIVGTYILGESLQAYLTADSSPKRKVIALNAIRAHFERAGLPVPTEFQAPVPTPKGKRGPRGPRSDSKLQKYQALLEQTQQLLADPEQPIALEYLQGVEAALNEAVARLQKLYEYAKNYQAKQRETEAAQEA